MAHATFAEGEVVQGETARLTLRVPHGCGDEATLRVRIQIPEGLIAAQPMVKAGWTLETVTGPYENSYELYGRTLTEGVREIIWSGELPDAFYDEFVFRARVTDRLPAGETGARRDGRAGLRGRSRALRNDPWPVPESLRWPWRMRGAAWSGRPRATPTGTI